MTEWMELLKAIRKIEEKYGVSLNKPATDSDIEKLKHYSKEKLSEMEISKSYFELLKEVNGLEFNGLVLYAVDPEITDSTEKNVHGFVETNLLWYENDWQKQFIFYGDSDTAWYCYDFIEKKYLELDKPSGTIMNTFIHFDSMLRNAFETVL